MENFNNKPVDPYQHLDFPSFDHPSTNNQDDSSIGLVELSLNLRNQLNSLKSIKKNFTRRFDNLLMSSEKKDPIREYETHFDVALTGSRGSNNYEQKYNDLKAKHDELEEVHQNLIEETQKTLRESKLGYEKEIKALKDELVQKNNYIDIMRQSQVQTQEKVNLMETRIASLEQLNSTLTTQLKEKAKDLSGSIDGVNNSMTSRSRDMTGMKNEFTRLVERVANLEDIIKNLREGKKQDMEALQELKNKNEELRTENFELLVQKKKLSNELGEANDKFSKMDKCLVERRQKTDEFINTLSRYESSFQVINQVNLDLETIFEPLKEQNRKLLAEKERLSEENRNMKVRLAKAEENGDSTRMEVEGAKGGKGSAVSDQSSVKEAASRGIDISFYTEIMEKLKEFEKQIATRDKEKQDLQNELDEIKSRNLELETKIISMNRSPRGKSHGQFLSVEIDSHVATSPRRKNVAPSPQNSEANRGGETDRETKDNEGKENQEAMEEEGEKDARLKITRKPKQIKKPSTMNLFTGIIICPNCSLIVKKSDKSAKCCTKCQGTIHELCAGDQKGDVMCGPCQKKHKKTAQEHEGEDEEDAKN